MPTHRHSLLVAFAAVLAPTVLPGLATAGEPPRSVEEYTRRMRAAMAAQDPETFAKYMAERGQVKVLYALAGGPEYQQYSKFVREQQVFTSITRTVNDLVRLKEDLFVEFRQCGKPDAYYSPKDSRITVCYEIVALLDQAFAGQSSVKDQIASVRGAMFFLFLHELGHALIDRLDLPATGKEEDSVDQFATLLLLEQGEEGERAVLAGAAFFLALAEEAARTGHKPPLWDEHSLNAQRFFNISCWLFGASPFHSVNLVAKGLLPAERAARCGDEYQRMHKAWKALLDPKLSRPLR